MSSFVRVMAGTPVRLLLVLLLLIVAGVASAVEPELGFRQRFEADGLLIEATVTRIAPAGTAEPSLRAGEPVRVRFALSDLTGKPLTGAFPNGWMVLRAPNSAGGNTDARCRVAVRRLQGSNLWNRAEVDLNSYAVLALNDDATISVLDPFGGFGGTRLLALVALDGVGEDWVELPVQNRLAVAVPDVDAINIVDTRSWSAAVQRLAVGAKPRRVAVQPDGVFLWVAAVDPATAAATAIAVNADTLAVAGRVPIGTGPHDFAFTADSRYLFVANAGSGPVTVIDIAAMAPVDHVAPGRRPVSLAYSQLADAVYVADAEDGSVTVLDAQTRGVRARITGPPGATQIRFAPGGRYAFLANPRAGQLTVIDSSLDRAIQRLDLAAAPDQVSFTATMAYVRQSKSPTVVMLPLDQMTAEPGKLPSPEFVAGTSMPATAERPSPAPAIVPVAGDRAVLVANSGDREIYYYQEGFAAPMGSFSNYKRQPRAVMVVRRDLRERQPGVYETNVELGRPGAYDLVFRLDRPPVYHCFPFEVSAAKGQQAIPAARVVPLAPLAPVPAGRTVSLDFVVTDEATGRPLDDLMDLTVLVMTPAWQTRKVATSMGNGRYGVDLVVPAPGAYAVMVRSAEAGIEYRTMPVLTITAAP